MEHRTVVALTRIMGHATISGEVIMNQVLRERTFASGQSMKIMQGDITQEDVDGIVNAANAHLQHGGGVAAVIVRRGGKTIREESNEWVRAHGSVTPTTPAYTTAGRLPYRYIIHAVGPVWGEGDENTKLAAAVFNSLKLADQLGLTTLAFPAISTGIFGFPKDQAAKVIFDAIRDFFDQYPRAKLIQVRLTLYDQPTVDVFLRVWDESN